MKLPLAVAAFAFIPMLLGSACSGGSDDPSVSQAQTPVADPGTDASTGNAAAAAYQRVIVHTGEGAFWFEPSRCSVYEEDGARLYAIAGAGKAPDGQPVYVTIEDEDHSPDTGAELRINVGVDAPFKSGDPVWIANDQQSIGLERRASRTEIDGNVLTFVDVVFGADGGAVLDVDRPIRVDCTR